MKTLVLIFSLMFSLSAAASLDEIPSNLTLGVSDFQSKALGHACFTMTSVVDHLPCNASFLAKEMDPTFTAQVFLGNNVSRLDDVDKLLAGHISEALVRDIFAEDNAIHVEGNVETSYRQKLWGVSFSPYRLTYYSLIRNSAYPVIDLHAMQEKYVNFQLATYLENDLHIGAQFRLVDRKFIHRQFALFDALAEGGDDFLEPNTQKAFYFEPGAHYELNEYRWKPVISATVRNLGAVDNKYEGFETDPILELGTSVKPEIRYGVLELGLNLEADQKSERKFHDRFRAAAAYSLGAGQGIMSFDANSYSLGMLLYFRGLRGGLVYGHDKVFDADDEVYYTETVYAQFGFEI